MQVFVKTGFTVGTFTATAFASTIAAGEVKASNQYKGKAKDPFTLNYAPHFGMFKEHAGDDLLDQLSFMADAGFRSLEDNGMMKRTPEMQEKIGKQLVKLGMDMGVFVVDKGGNAANSLAAGKSEFTDIFLDGCRRAVDVAKRVNAKCMTVVPGNFERKIPIGIQTANVIEALRRGAEIFEPHGLVMVLEPLSDTPDLFLRYSDQTYLICKGVNSPSCKILYDIYHMQKNEGQLITNMDLTWDGTRSRISRLAITLEGRGRRRERSITPMCSNTFTTRDTRGYWGWSMGTRTPAKRESKR